MAFDFPSAPTNGQVFIPVPGGPTYSWDGTAWVLTSGGVSGGVYIGDTAPPNPVPGQLWWESDSGNTFIYYADGSSSQWVQFNVTDEQEHLNRIVRTVISASGTYTKPSGLKFLEVIVVGAGGGVPAAPLTAAGNASSSSGAGGGGAASKLYAAADVAATVAMTVGAQGTGTPTAGGATTFAGLSGGGGNAGAVISASTTWGYAGNSAGGAGSGGDWNVSGGSGGMGGRYVSSGVLVGEGGAGGGSLFVPTNPEVQHNTTVAPANGFHPGGGARGAANGASQAATVAASGGVGRIILTEYF